MYFSETCPVCDRPFSFFRQFVWPDYYCFGENHDVHYRSSVDEVTDEIEYYLQIRYFENASSQSAYLNLEYSADYYGFSVFYAADRTLLSWYHNKGGHGYIPIIAPPKDYLHALRKIQSLETFK